MDRREFMALGLSSAGALFAGCIGGDFMNRADGLEITEGEPRIDKSNDGRVYLLRTENRVEGVKKLLENFNLRKMDGKRVAIKANFNSMDPFPASTHPETLKVIFESLKEYTDNLVLAERSGMGDTERILKGLGILDIAEQNDVEVVILDRHKRWVKFDAEHWLRGFLFADVFYHADFVVQTCCLKTHRFGGHFTLSLKNSVGMVAKKTRFYDYMAELHLSPNQRKMIAEINIAYFPEFIILDAIEGFAFGGPDKGRVIKPKLLIAGRDRVAVDAVGVAILRHYGTTPEVSKGRIFDQEQIKRAVELGIGVSSPEEIEVIPLNRDAEGFAEIVESELKKQA